MLLKLVLPILTFWLLENFKYISAHSHSGQAHLRFRSHLWLGHHNGSSGTAGGVPRFPGTQKAELGVCSLGSILSRYKTLK